MDNSAKELYRYEDIKYAAPLDEFDNPVGNGRLELRLLCYPVIRTTPKGVWINIYGNQKFVNLTAHKRFACPSVKEAKESFVARKNKQLKILRGQVGRVQHALILALDLK